MNGQYEVLNPWAEADPIPLKGITPRVADLDGKTVGLFATITKPAAQPILTVVERKLKERFPKIKFSWFLHGLNIGVAETADKGRFEEWAKGIDAAITSVGD